jgi:hypothetical protein
MRLESLIFLLYGEEGDFKAVLSITGIITAEEDAVLPVVAFALTEESTVLVMLEGHVAEVCSQVGVEVVSLFGISQSPFLCFITILQLIRYQFSVLLKSKRCQGIQSIET